MMGIFATVTECPTCHGHGEVSKEICKKCKGAGITKEKDTIEFSIPAGIKHGDTLRISGRGEAIKNGQSGDLFVQILVKSHKTFRRNGLDLILEHEVPMSEAVLGNSSLRFCQSRLLRLKPFNSINVRFCTNSQFS